MGLFSKKYGSSNIEKELEALYVPLFQQRGMSISQARSTFNDILERVKEESIKEGTSNLPPDFGDVLLDKEASDEKVKSMLSKKRKEGVKDHDIRWWWNMHELERRIMLSVDDISRLSVFRKLRESSGLDVERASREVRKTFPIFGDPEDTTHTTGEDRPLPVELKDRVNIYIQKRSLDPISFKKEMEESSTFNALIRKEIRKGNV